MKALEDAIADRFNSDKSLKRFGRRLHFGLNGEPLKTVPFVDITLDGPDAELDTFDADIESYTATFTIFGKDSIVDNLHRALKEMRRVFDDCSLVSSEFDLVQFHRIGGSMPVLVENKFRATRIYTVIVQLKTLIPVTRVG